MQVIIFTDSNGALGFGRYAGPYRIATEIRNAGFTCQVVDFFAELSQNQLLKVVDKYVTKETLWIGFSTTLFAPEINSEIIKEKILSGDYNNSFMIENWKTGIWPRSKKHIQELYDRIKTVNSSVKFVLGGTKAVRSTQYIPIDYYIWGEADTSAVELTRHLKNNSHPIKADEFGNSKRIISEDYLPGSMHYKSIKWEQNDFIFPKEVLPIELSRGCIFRCSYCSFKNLGKKNDDNYLRKIESFKEEVIRNYEMFGTQSYMFSDDTFNDSPKKVANYAECIQSLPFKLSWAGYCRIDMFANSNKMIYDTKLTNPDFINFGIETFSHRAGKNVGKGMDPNKVKDTLYKVKEILGSQTVISCNFIAGLKYETEDEIWQTVEWLTQKDCPVDAFNVTPLYVIHYKRDVHDRTSDFSNEIGNNPYSHGYDYDLETGYWKHETMDQIRAHEIVQKIYKMQEAQTKTLANRIGFFGRLQNLGLSLEDLRTVTASNAEPVLKLVNKKIELKNKYYKNLLQY